MDAQTLREVMQGVINYWLHLWLKTAILKTSIPPFPQ